MAMSTSSIIPTKSFVQTPISHQSSLPVKPRSIRVSAVHSTEPPKKPPKQQPQAAVSSSPSPTVTAETKTTSRKGKWSLDSWKSMNALQQPEYPDPVELESVLKTLEDFPPIVFAGEARNLEERLAEAAMGNAFLLQGGDCAESFKEFNANNIRDTFRILLQMGAVLMFGGQMPVIKVLFTFAI